MINKNINRIPVYILTIIILSSCTAPIDINTRNSEPVVVIYGQLTDENKHQHIRVSGSTPYFAEKTNTAVSDAIVNIISSEGEEFNFLEDENGYYFSEKTFAAKPGITYDLTVKVDFNKDGQTETYEASTTILPVITADSIDVKPINIMGYRHFALNFYMQEPPETDNYYLFIFYVNDSLTNNRISEFLFSDDRMFNGEYIEGATINFFEDATDQKNLTAPGADEESNYMISPGDKIRLQIINIEKGYYNFISQCVSEKYGENPFFGGPPSNITTNISNGAVGYFTGFCLQEYNATAP